MTIEFHEVIRELKPDDCETCGGGGDNDPSGDNGSDPRCQKCNGTGKKQGGEVRWGHALEAKPEKWEGAYKTRDEAIDAGRAFHEGSQFYIQRGALAWGPEYMPDAEAIETMLWDAAYTDVDEAAEGFPDITPEAKAELDAFLTAWAEKHVKAKFWLTDDSPPILYTAVGQLKLAPST